MNMNRFNQFLLLTMLFIAGSTISAISGTTPVSQYGKTNIADMVLIYYGGVHRTLEWNKDQFTPYVVHQNQQGKKDWLFDGFLFTEFLDGKGHHFAHGNEKTTLARRPEWEWLMERQFEKNKVLKEASIAYYEGGGTIYEFYRSKNPLDKEVMDRLAKIIIQRKKMKLPIDICLRK